ncbi:MAG: amidase domain-containing protein [Micromonosporaceae bacterium]|nr:amidase domain-containing protein [Micromonosporaceae bacterium]
MVTYLQLRDAQPQLFAQAAAAWSSRSRTAMDAARTLRRHRDDLGQAWRSSAGDGARDRLTELMHQMLIASAEYRAVGSIVQGLAHAFHITQNSLRHGLDIAERHRIRVDDNGAVYPPLDAAPDDRLAADSGTWRTVCFLLCQAVDGATRADAASQNGLAALADAVDQRDVDRALDNDLALASRLEMSMIAGVLPEGDAEQVTAWWASLTADDRDLLKQAAAPELAGLDGIPQDVKNELHGAGTYDAAGAAGWAETHWNDRSDDIFDNNCTNFASTAVHDGGGVDYQVGSGGLLDHGTWEVTASWVQAPELHDFMVEHRGYEVSQAEARPGDLVFWEDEHGTIHYTAVVTGTIDGDIRSTQHSSPRLDASLDGRLEIQEHQDGGSRQTIHIVRVNPDW